MRNAWLRSLVIGLLVFTVGCSSAPGAAPGTGADTPAPAPGAGSPSPDTAPGAPAERPEVTAIIVSANGAERRFTAADTSRVWSTPGALTLRAELSADPGAYVVQWYFQGFLNQAPGEVPAEEQRVPIAAGQEVSVNLGPGTLGMLWAELRAADEPASDQLAGAPDLAIHPAIGLAETAQCPAIAVEPPPAQPGADEPVDYGETVHSREMNYVVMYYMGKQFWIPLSADPATCNDPYVAEQLRQVQEMEGRR